MEPRLARWKSKEEISLLRENNRCLRCERQGCYTRICTMLPSNGVANKNDVSRPKEVARGPSGKFLRAKWKTADQIERLRMECRCFRCERQGCNTKICPVLPAVNPKFSRFSVVSTVVKEKQAEQNTDEQKKLGNHEALDFMEIKPNRPLGIMTVQDPEKKMNTSPFLVNALVNDLRMVQALVDNGCLCSGIIDDSLVTELNLPRHAISPRTLQTAENSPNEKPTVKYITHVSIDLDGIVTKQLWLYVVPHSVHQIILGKNG